MRRAVALLALLGSTAAGESQRVDELVERYRRGERAEALAGLSRLSYNEAVQGYVYLKRFADEAQRGDDAASREQRERLLGTLRAAVMLHWDRDDADRPPFVGVEQPRGCPGRYAELAARYAGLLARWAESRDSARRFFLAASHASQWDFCLVEALRFAREGSKLFPRDAELLLAAGSVLEERAALAPIRLRAGLATLKPAERDSRQAALVAREHMFKDARRDLEDAVAADPGLVLAWVRLGRVLWRLGEGERARSALEQAVALERPPMAAMLLARLFLGQVHEDAGRLEQATGEYRRALAVDPNAQSAAVALSHALRKAGDGEGSRRVLLDALAHAGRRTQADVFWNYFTSNALGFAAELDGLRREALR